MGRYREGWLLVTAVVATVGVWAALWTWPVGGVLGTFACAAFAGCSIATSVAREPGRRRTRPVVAAGAAAGVTAVSAAGLVALLGAPGLLVAGVLSATCPQLWRWLSIRWWRLTQAPGTSAAPNATDPTPDTGRATVPARFGGAPEPTPEMPSDPSLLDDYALCCAWRSSHLALEHPHSPQTHLRVVQQRQQYLDELERRNPTGVAAWLASGARAGGDPTRYIVPRRP